MPTHVGSYPKPSVSKGKTTGSVIANIAGGGKIQPPAIYTNKINMMVTIGGAGKLTKKSIIMVVNPERARNLPKNLPKKKKRQTR